VTSLMVEEEQKAILGKRTLDTTATSDGEDDTVPDRESAKRRKKKKGKGGQTISAKKAVHTYKDVLRDSSPDERSEIVADSFKVPRELRAFGKALTEVGGMPKEACVGAFAKSNRFLQFHLCNARKKCTRTPCNEFVEFCGEADPKSKVAAFGEKFRIDGHRLLEAAGKADVALESSSDDIKKRLKKRVDRLKKGEGAAGS
jgi:hypothetical protein